MFKRNPAGLDALLSLSTSIGHRWRADFERIDSSQKLVDLRSGIIKMIKSSCDVLYRKNNPNGRLTVGVEIEFFLRNSSGLLASWSESQEFLRMIARSEEWKIFKKDLQDRPGPEEIEWISKESKGGKYSKIKYEYAPHLLEVSATFFDNLHDLNDEWDYILSSMHKAAEELRFTIERSPLIDLPNDQNLEQRHRAVYLDFSRRKFLTLQSGSEYNDIANFPAYTASTQVQIGGLRWWAENNCAIETLYGYEAYAFIYGSWLFSKNFRDSFELYNLRLSLYSACFPGFCLVGFPPFENWNLLNWVNGMFTGPLTGSSSDKYSGETLINLDSDSFNESIFTRLRDFQYIRPRHYGTVEFRGCPSLINLKDIVALAAFRFGLACCAESELPKASLKRSVEVWQRNKVFANCDLDGLDEMLLKARRALTSRGLGEEKFLIPIDI